MAKISTYPGPSSPSLSDMLIGTDVNDMLMTKNFTISDIISVAGSSTYVPYTGGNNDVFLPGYGFYANEFVVYGGTSSQFLKADGSIDSNVYALASSLALYVPYTGATSNVVLGSNTISASGYIVPGGTSSDFLKADGSVDPSTYLTTSSAASTYVPYTGATGNVDLGSKRLTAQSLRITTDDAEMIGISCFPGAQNYFGIGSNGWIMSGFLVDFVNNRYYLGDWGTAVNGTYIKVDDANTRIELSKGIYTNGSEGAIGDVLVSQGAGFPAQWTSAPAPVYGSFYDMNTFSTLGSVEEFMEFGSSAGSSDVSIVNNGLGNPTQITVAQTGVYNIQFSAQLTKTGGTVGDVNIYFKKNGVNLGGSNTIVTLANNNHYVVASWNIFVPLNAGQYVEIVWYTTNANVQLIAIPAVPPVDTVPSVILTVNKVG
jgi:hypothetical protein